jgi:hypothetical protein
MALIAYGHGRMQDFGQGGQLLDCNSLSGSNSLNNRVLHIKTPSK